MSSETVALRHIHVRASAVLGVGLGGFFDGIVFHQLLQWHHMISSATPPETVSTLQLNIFFDGLFHGATWVITLIGIWLLRRVGDGHGHRTLTGGLLLGWGLFNLVEGVIDHYVLGIHHVRPGPDQSLYDIAFLIWGGIFVVVGGWILRDAGSREKVAE
jgi:uncharacterized membrane protein